MVHSQEDLDMAIAASNILFGKATKENLAQLDEATLNDVFANVPHYDLDKNLLGGTAVDLFNQEGMQIFPSKSEMRKLVKGGGVSLNKEKLNAFDQVITADDLIDGKYLFIVAEDIGDVADTKIVVGCHCANPTHDMARLKTERRQVKRHKCLIIVVCKKLNHSKLMKE